jgi:hypothetical protein
VPATDGAWPVSDTRAATAPDAEGVLGWGLLLGVAFGARWTAAGFTLMTAVFGVQTFGPVVLSTRAVLFVLIFGAFVLFAVGSYSDDPSPVWARESGAS